ncbi:MAG: hemerythrin domain-containing protein [Ignavibacteria bacterium]
MSNLIFDNPSLLLLMEHCGLNSVVQEKTVLELCKEQNISVNIFVTFANLYNGFSPSLNDNLSIKDISEIIMILESSHNYYENEKCPEIKNYIRQLYSQNDSPEIKLIDKFFDEYFEEVKEHFSYEDEIAFPYFNALLQDDVKDKAEKKKYNFSVEEYSEHHTDIESKLNDLKELLLKHVPLQNDRILRRKIVVDLFELEYDLNIHHIIEETILIPLVRKLEKSIYN